MRYFKKAIVSTKLYMANGAPAPFEPVGDEHGVLATENSDIIIEMERAMAHQRGGIENLTEGEYQELKKNPPARQSRQSSPSANGFPSRLNQNRVDRVVERSAPAPAVDSEPLVVPNSIPRTARVGDIRRVLKSPAELFPLKVPAPLKGSAPAARAA